ncbi:uncharacterized protein LOC144860690 [Branchiostoma floridae x Branchiostoma japonicum]
MNLQILNIYSSSSVADGIYSVVITSLSSGSIVVQMTITTDPSAGLTADDLQEAFLTSNNTDIEIDNTTELCSSDFCWTGVDCTATDPSKICECPSSYSDDVCVTPVEATTTASTIQPTTEHGSTLLASTEAATLLPTTQRTIKSTTTMASTPYTTGQTPTPTYTATHTTSWPLPTLPLTTAKQTTVEESTQLETTSITTTRSSTASPFGETTTEAPPTFSQTDESTPAMTTILGTESVITTGQTTIQPTTEG